MATVDVAQTNTTDSTVLQPCKANYIDTCTTHTRNTPHTKRTKRSAAVEPNDAIRSAESNPVPPSSASMAVRTPMLTPAEPPMDAAVARGGVVVGATRGL